MNLTDGESCSFTDMMGSYLLKTEHLFKENEKSRKLEELDKGIHQASSKLEILGSELNYTKNLLNCKLPKENNTGFANCKSFEHILLSGETKSASARNKNESKDKFQGMKLLLSAVSSPTIPLDERCKEDESEKTTQELKEGYRDEDGERLSPMPEAFLHPLSRRDKPDTQDSSIYSMSMSGRLSNCSKTSLRGNYGLNYHNSESLSYDNQELQTFNVADKEIEFKGNKRNEHQLSSKQSTHSLAVFKFRRRKFLKSDGNFKLSRKKSVMSKMSDALSNKAKRKKGKLKSVTSRCTVITADVACNERKNLRNKKIKSDHYIYPEFNYERKNNVLNNFKTTTRGKYVEIDRVCKQNTVFVSVDEKPEEEQRLESPVKPVASVEKTVTDVASPKIEKIKTNNPKKESEAMLLRKQEMKNKNVVGHPKENEKNEQEKTKEQIQLKCSNTNEEIKPKKLNYKSESVSYGDFMATKSYENSTTASRLKQADMSYYRKFHFKYIPFIAGTSITPSHNLGLNVQRTLGLMKNKQVIMDGSTQVLIRKISRGMKPISSLLTEVDPQVMSANAPTYRIHNIWKTPDTTAIWTSPPSVNESEKKSTKKSFTLQQKDNDSCEQKKGSPIEISQKMPKDSTVDMDSYKVHAKDLMEIRSVFVKLHDDLQELNEKYDKLQSRCEKTNSSILKQELAELEKELSAKEEEINVFMYIYKEMMALKQQLKEINERHRLACITTTDVSRMQTKYHTSLQKWQQKSQSFFRNSNIRLLIMLKKFQLSQKQCKS